MASRHELLIRGVLRTRLPSRAQNLSEIAAGALRLTSVKYDSLTVVICGSTAILTGIADNTGEFRGFPFSGKIRVITLEKLAVAAYPSSVSWSSP